MLKLEGGMRNLLLTATWFLFIDQELCVLAVRQGRGERGAEKGPILECGHF